MEPSNDAAEITAPKERRVLGVPFTGGGDPRRANGRPKGARNRLGEDFLKAMAEDFEEHGKVAIAKVREDRPQDYLKVIASILPKIVSVKTDELEDQTDDELRAAYAREVRKLIAFGVAVGVEIGTDADREAAALPAGSVQALQ
jgi:hypothetical protein